MNDQVSLYIYAWDKEKHDLKIILNNHKSLLTPPRTNIFNSSKMKSSTFYTKAHEGTSSDVENLKINTFEALWTKGVEEIWNAMISNEISWSKARVTLKLISVYRAFSVFSNQFYCHASFAIKVSLQQLVKCSVDNQMVAVYRMELKRGMLERYKIFLIIEELYQMIEAGNAKKCTAGADLPGCTFEEISPSLIFSEEGKEFSILSPSTLCDSPGYTHLDRECLYEEFIQLSFPFSTIVFDDIRPLLTLLGFKDKEQDVFRALDANQCQELDVFQFIMGLTAMDPLTQHGNTPAEFRCRLIFRMYDEDRDGFLSQTEVTKMIQDIWVLQNVNQSSHDVNESVQNAFKTFGVDPKEKVSIVQFLTSVGNLRFRGTSALFRASNTVPNLVRKMLSTSRALPISLTETESKLTHARADGQHFMMSGMSLPPNASKAINFVQTFSPPNDIDDLIMWPVSSGYSLAEHTVMVRRSGSVTKAAHLLDMERAGEVGNTGLETLFENEEYKDGKAVLPASVIKNRVKKQYSAQAFNIRSLPNEILTSLRYFEYSLKDKPPMNWGVISNEKLIKYIIAVCQSVKDIFESEPRLLCISTPCYVLGDLHGNFHDLICFEKVLWRLGPHLTPANFLFLGDYVDRGQYGIEVIIYLLAQKLKTPGNFFLLRGNHEVREVQQFFSFHSECLEKFGEQMGQVVWEEINGVFDRMPLAAVVDKKIFCIHGGIPNLNEPLSVIDQIPCPLRHPEEESPIAWQMMWNDPVSANTMNCDVEAQLAANQGFADNINRQTAYVFNEEAFQRFLQKNHLTHVIRAHEVKQAGFEIQQNGRLMTVFSSSQYCGLNNDAACILVHNMRIRVIRVDTT